MEMCQELAWVRRQQALDSGCFLGHGTCILFAPGDMVGVGIPKGGLVLGVYVCKL